MADDKKKGRWAENVSRYRPGSASARAGVERNKIRPWHVAESAQEESADEPVSDTRVVWARNLPLDEIVPDPDQPRRTFDETSIRELSESIRGQGVLQPLIVRRNPEGNTYTVVAGERRLRAARLAGLTEVPCRIIAGDSIKDARLAQLIENLQREDLTPLEEVRAIVQLAELEGMSQDELASKLGKSVSYISRIYSISRIASDDYDRLATLQVSLGTLYEFAQLPDDPTIRASAIELIQSGATVRDLAALREGRRGAKEAGRKGRGRADRKRGRPMKGSAPVDALAKAVDRIRSLDERAVERLSDAQREAIVRCQLELARWSSEHLAADRSLLKAVEALERAISPGSDERSS